MVYYNIKQKHCGTGAFINKHKMIQKRQLNMKSSITFLIKCRKAGITPDFLTNSTKNVYNIFKTDYLLPKGFENSLNTVMNNFHRKILNILIRQKHEMVKHNSLEMKKIENTINKYLSQEEQTQFWESEKVLGEKRYTTIKNVHKKKFEKLKEKQRENLGISHNDKWFVNKTDTNIPDDIQWLLSLGQKYSIPTDKKNFPLFKLIADGEDCIQTIEDREEQEMTRTKFVSMLENHINKHNLTGRERFILSTVDKTRRFLHKNKHILVLNADKGNVTVMMNKKDYETRMNDILGDMMTYRRINKDPTSSLQRKNGDLVDELFRCNALSNLEKTRLKNDAATAPRIYGLPKIHKDNFPLRPICASVNSPASGLCQLLTGILKKLTENSVYNIRDAVQFKDRLNNAKINSDEKMVSFDVVSLFPSIPVDYAIRVIDDKWDELEKHTTIPRNLFMRILKFCIKENRYFKYNDKIYTQCKGLPMGSPASPVVADIVMEELLNTCIGQLKEKPRLFTEYVDDLFGIIKNSAIDDTLNVLNNFHRQIQFTIEEENNCRLPYLDTVIIRDGENMTMDWYQKPTASGRIINFHSCQPKHVIMNTANNFIKRVLTISDEKFHKNNKDKIIRILRMNSFPIDIIRNLLRNSKRRGVKDKTEPMIYKSMTYVPGISERLEKSGIYNKERYRIALTTNNTLRQLFSNTKSKIDKMDNANLIYKIKCNGDGSEICEQVYIGTTKNKLRTRIAGHRSDLRNKNKLSTQKTALMSHCAERDHIPNLDNIEILQRENKNNKRYMLEMLHIINVRREKRMNYKTDTENCAQSYRHIINKIRL